MTKKPKFKSVSLNIITPQQVEFYAKVVDLADKQDRSISKTIIRLAMSGMIAERKAYVAAAMKEGGSSADG